MHVRGGRHYPASKKAFRPTGKRVVDYRVAAADCDMYNVLFHPRVQEILETVARRSDCTASYINLRLPVKPFDELIAYQSLANFELPHSD